MTTTPRPDLVPVSVPASTAASFITARSLDPGQTLEDDGTQPTKGTIWELSHTPVAATITYTTRKGTPLHTTKGTTTAQEDTLNLWAIGVDKAWQNQGIAHKTITHLQQKAQAEASTLIIHSVGSQQLKHILRTMKYQETRDGRWSTFKAQNQNPTTKPQHTPTTPPRRPLPHPTTPTTTTGVLHQ